MISGSTFISSQYDIVIIGGGVSGCLIAYRLSKFNISVCLVEKEADLACGATGANSAIVHSGYDPEPGTLKAKYNVRGNSLFDELCRDLGVPFIRNGSLIIAFNEEENEQLVRLKNRGEVNGVPGLRILSASETLELEPAISPGVYSSLFAPTGGIVCPYELTFAAAETAYANGVDFVFGQEVTSIGISEDDPYRYSVGCDGGVPGGDLSLKAKVIVDAAGAYADKVAAMAGDTSFSIIPRRGEYSIVDKQIGRLVTHTIFQTPTAKGKGVLVTPAVDENIIVGPNAHQTEDPGDTSTSAAGVREIWSMAGKSVPSLDRKYSIRDFAGIRATPSTHDFVIGQAPGIPGFFRAAGIESPGLTAAPAFSEVLTEEITEYLMPEGPALKNEAVMTRKAPVRFRDLSLESQGKLIAEDPRFANVICRCENITEAEIVDAIRRTIGEVTVNGIKMRTRSGMGRCQGGFCLPRVLSIIARETAKPVTSVTLSGNGSDIVTGRTR